jgi:hypothetical protein
MIPGQKGGNRKKKTIKKCEHCGGNFIAGRLKQRFCSNFCKKAKLKGAGHPRWKGGKSLETRRARATMEYKRWRDTVFARDNYTCQDCKRRSRAGARIEINAHHIKGLAEHKECRYNLDNGITLCVECHRKIHFG